MKKHLFLFILTLAFLSASNVWAGEQYIFPVTEASTVSGGTINTDANGNWYAELSNENDYVEIPFTVDNSREYLVKIGYTTEETGAELRLGFYRYDSYIAAFGNHGISTATSITEKDCGAQLNTTYIDGCKPYKLRIQPAPNKTMQVYYMKLVSNDATTQPTANITSGLNFVATTTTGDQIITNSDFLYSHKKEDRVKTQNKEGYDRTTFTNGYVTAASRKLYTFETGTYKFTLQVFTEESNTYNKPYVFVNNVVVGGGTYYFDKDDASAGGKYRDWEIEIDVTAGTYPIAFYFPSVNEKLFYRLASVEKKATSACPSAYSFHYGTNEQSDWTIACFENGAETDERVIENFTIPTVPEFYVGWQGNPLDNDMTVLHSWNDDVSDLGNGVMNGAMVLLPVRGTSNVGWAKGAVGTLRCWYGSKSKNQYVGFQPNGYAIMYGGNNYAFEETGTANKLETDVVTLPAVSTTYQMGIATADSYVTCAHSNAAEAISNMGVTVKGNGGKAIYLVPGSFDDAGAKYAVWDGTNSAFDGFMTDADGDGIYVGYVGSNCSTINLVRLNSNTTDEEIANSTNNYKAAWDKKWNQTSNIGISGDLAKKYTITSLSGDNCSYTTANMQPITGQKGKFRMWDNSADQNWYVHFIPYYVLTYNSNGGSGTTAATERNSESSTLTVSVAANGFTAPTGHEFAGWNTVAEGGGDLYAAGASYTLTANGTLYAQWSPLSYTVTLNTNDGTINAGDVTSYTYGTGATLPTDVTKTGYDFGGWYDNSELTGDRVYSIANNVTGNTTITIDANTANHGSSTPGTVTATWGQALPVFTAASGVAGYGLIGYYTGANDGTKVINADGTLVQNVTGYTSNDATPVWIYETSTLTLYPHYEEMTTYAVTVNRNNSSYGTVTGAGSYASGAIVNITATPAGGYEFVNWTTSDGVTFADANSASTSFTMIGSAVTVTANFRAETCESGYTLEVEDDFVIVTPGDRARTTPQGEGWYNTGYYTGFHGNGFFDMRGSDGEIYLPVHLNGGTYSFTIYNLNGNNKRLRLYSKTSSAYTTITYEGSTYYRMSNDGYTVTGSDGSGGEGTAFVSCQINNVALSAGDYIIGLKSDGWASWDQVVITNTSTYNVTYATGDSHGTSISAANTSTSADIGYGSSVSACTNVTFTATPASGYEVDYWKVNDVQYPEADGETTFSIDVNRNIMVKFYTKEASNYAVTVNTNNGSYGSASADAATYASGATVTLTATPKEGYRFVNWTTSDPISITDATSASTTFTMIASAVTVQANFAEATCMSTKTIEAESYIPDWFAYRSGEGISKPTDGEFSGTSYVQFNQETEINYFVSLPAANYRFHIYHGGTGNNKYFNLYGLDDSAGSDYVTYNGHKYKNTAYKGTALNAGGSRWTDQVVACDLPANDYIIGLYGNDGSNIIYDKIVIEAYGNVDNNVFCYHSITMNTTAGTAGEATSGVARALLGDIVTISAPAASSGYHFTGWTASPSVTFTSDPSVASNSFTMPNENVTLTANYALDEYTISSLPWEGSQDLTGQTVVSADAINSCFDSEITFTFTGEGPVSYYDNTNRSSSLGTVTSGTAITLTDALRAHGIYIRCTSGAATLTAVSKTTIGSVYQIWSGNVAVGDWSQQVVLGPEHFQTAAEGDVLRVNTSGEGGDAQGALQYIYTDGDSHTYKGLDNSTGGGLRDWSLSSEDKSRHYFEITINETHLANLQRHGVIVKGRNYTIQSVELRASCSNQTMRTSAPDVTTYGDDGRIDIMTDKLELDGEGFNLGNWEHKLELHESCFTRVTVGSIINFYMKVEDGATLSFRCNVDSVHAKSYEEPPLCPSYGDISFDRTIDDLYGDTPTLIGRIQGYKVLYLLVDADMLRRLKETGMILCGKGTLIKVVEGVPETVVVEPGQNKSVPTVVNNLTIHQGGEVTNESDIEVLGNITYIRPAKDDGTSYKLGNKLDQWYTFALPFTVSDVEVYDEAEETWYDINAVYYSSDVTDQVANAPDGAGHYYLQYLKAENETVPGAFAARWQYITPGHSLACVSEYVANNGTRYGYPKKDEAYIILFDSEQPIGDYFETNTQVRFVGVGPQTIDGVAKKWKVEADGEQYWMYANNTLHSFTLTDAYILNDEGTYFILQSNPTIRPFECYVQATESLKTRYAALPMRGFHIDNTPTGMESMQGSAIRAEKILRNGQLIIIRNGVEYDATGAVIR